MKDENNRDIRIMVIECWKKGMTMSQIAREITKQVIRAFPDYEIKKRRVVELHKAGFMVTRIVKETGTSYGFVKNTLRREGIYG